MTLISVRSVSVYQSPSTNNITEEGSVDGRMLVLFDTSEQPRILYRRVPTTRGTEPPSAVPDSGDHASPDASAIRLPRADAVVTGLLMAVTLIVFLSQLMMGVALPTLVVELDISASTGQWLTTGYMLTLAILVPATGFVMRRFHLRSIYLTSLAIFAIGTALAAAAPGFGMLLVGRLVQAVGTAVFVPLLMATVMRLVPQPRRAQIMALAIITTAIAPAFGPAVSGIITSQLGWRWLFILTLPPTVLGLLVGARQLRNISTPEPVRLDVFSIALSAVGFGGVVYGLASIGEAAAGDPPMPPWIAIFVGAVSIAGFAARQVALQRRDEPLLDLRVLVVRDYTVPLLVTCALSMPMMGTVVVLPLVLSSAKGLSPLEIGAFLIPGGLTIALVSALGGRNYERVGPFWLIVPGAIIVVAMNWRLSQVDASTTVANLIVTLIAMCAGQSLMWSPLTTAALSALPEHLQAHGSAVLATIQQLGGAIGTAVMVSAYSFGAGVATTGELSVEAALSAAESAFTAAMSIACVSFVLTLLIRRPRGTTTNRSKTHTKMTEQRDR